MTDSPAVRIPLDPEEQPILDKLLAVRTKLELLKQDRSTYVKSQDVVDLYDQVVEQVISLNDIRDTHAKRLEQNRGIYCSFGGNVEHMLTTRQSTQYLTIVFNSYRLRI